MNISTFRKILAAIVLCSLLALTACAASLPAGPTKLSDGDSGKSITLNSGATLTIDLEENATTGFSWKVDGAVPAILQPVGDTAKAADESGVVGAASRHVFEYTATDSGEGELKLVYVKLWESGVTPEKTFTVKVTVK